MKPANGNANPNSQLNDKAYFCTACGAADVTASALAGGDASCNVCGWKGHVEDLSVFHFSQDLGSPEEVFRRFFMDVRQLFAKQLAQDLGQLLLKWGFMDTPTPKNMKAVQHQLARYLAGAAKAVAVSIVATRAELEKEKHNATTG